MLFSRQKLSTQSRELYKLKKVSHHCSHLQPHGNSNYASCSLPTIAYHFFAHDCVPLLVVKKMHKYQGLLLPASSGSDGDGGVRQGWLGCMVGSDGGGVGVVGGVWGVGGG